MFFLKDGGPGKRTSGEKRTEGCFSSQPHAAAVLTRSSQSRDGRNRSLYTDSFFDAS